MENTNKKNKGSFNQSNSSERRTTGTQGYGSQSTSRSQASSREHYGSQNEQMRSNRGSSAERSTTSQNERGQNRYGQEREGSQYGSNKNLSGSRSHEGVSAKSTRSTGRNYESDNSDYDTDYDND